MGITRWREIYHKRGKYVLMGMRGSHDSGILVNPDGRFLKGLVPFGIFLHGDIPVLADKNPRSFLISERFRFNLADNDPQLGGPYLSAYDPFSHSSSPFEPTLIHAIINSENKVVGTRSAIGKSFINIPCHIFDGCVISRFNHIGDPNMTVRLFNFQPHPDDIILKTGIFFTGRLEPEDGGMTVGQMVLYSGDVKGHSVKGRRAV